MSSKPYFLTRFVLYYIKFDLWIRFSNPRNKTVRFTDQAPFCVWFVVAIYWLQRPTAFEYFDCSWIKVELSTLPCLIQEIVIGSCSVLPFRSHRIHVELFCELLIWTPFRVCVESDCVWIKHPAVFNARHCNWLVFCVALPQSLNTVWAVLCIINYLDTLPCPCCIEYYL